MCMWGEGTVHRLRAKSGEATLSLRLRPPRCWGAEYGAEECVSLLAVHGRCTTGSWGNIGQRHGQGHT